MADLNQMIAELLNNSRTNSIGSKIESTIGGYGKRLDSTQKQNGYFGPLKTSSGDVATELSIGVNFDGKEQLIPSLVPTLNRVEVDHLLSGQKPTKQIVDKAVSFARQRLSQGLSPFASNQEIPYGIKLQ